MNTMCLSCLLLIFSCLWALLQGTHVANNTKREVLEWGSTFLNDPSVISLSQFNEKSYYTSKFKSTFIEAYQLCKNIHMQLVTVQSSQELDALTKFAQQTSTEQIFWTSGSRLVDNKNWIWMTTLQVVEFTKWSGGQPDLLVEQCLELWFQGKELYFNNRDCNAKQAFICEKSKQTECLSTLENQYIYPNINLLHFQEKSYYFGTHFKASFVQANQFCENIQMKLVSINSEAENKELHKYARDTLATGNFWSSGFKFDNNKKFVWLSTGRIVDYTNWSPGQPGTTNELCIELVYNRNQGIVWNDLNCEAKLFFICERFDGDLLQDAPVPKPKPTAECAFPPKKQYVSPNINLLHSKGKSYYFSTFIETFSQASEFCGMIGMKLVSVNSEEENKLLHKYIRNTVAGDSFWSSGSRLINGKNLIWLSTGKVVDYTNWLTAQPDNVNEMCIQLIQNRNLGLFWNDFNCEVKLHFICERYDDDLFHDGTSIFEPRSKPTATSFSDNDGHIDPSFPTAVIGGMKFRVSKFKAIQQKASQTCKEVGMELVTISNKAKNNIVTELIRQYGSDDYYWTSGVTQSGKWIWLTEKPILYSNWYNVEPESDDNLCIQLNSSGQWSALKCDEELLFICENPNVGEISYCKPQPTLAIHVHINSNKGYNVTSEIDSQVNCRCDAEGYEVDGYITSLMEPRK